MTHEPITTFDIRAWRQLKTLLANCFNMYEIRAVCFDLGLDYEDISLVENKLEFVLNFLRYVAKHNLTSSLLKILHTSRPDLPWPSRLPPFVDTDQWLSSDLPQNSRFQHFIDEKSLNFVGRDFVFRTIDQFVSSERNGYFEIIADPGMGKSAITAQLVRQKNVIAHFNIRSQGINTAKDFLENVCLQLIERYDLPYSSLPKTASQDGNFFSHLLSEASKNVTAETPIILAVDALDEADVSSSPSGSNLLFLPQTLPEHVFIILTKRRGVLPLNFHTAYERLDLMQHFSENLADVQTYIDQELHRDNNLQQWVNQQNGLSRRLFIDELAELSQNNFMYLRYILPDIARGKYEELTIHELPVGLQGYYEDHWARMGMRTHPIPRTKLKIIYIMCESRSLASRQLIAEFAEESELTVQEVIDEWSQFLQKQTINSDIGYSLYHASFRDFLQRKDIVQAAGIEIKNIHGLIADHLWAELYG